MHLLYILRHFIESFHAKPSELCIQFFAETQSISEGFDFMDRISLLCYGSYFDHKDVLAVNSGNLH